MDGTSWLSPCSPGCLDEGSQACAEPTSQTSSGETPRDLHLAERWVQQWGAEDLCIGNSPQHGSTAFLLACLALTLLLLPLSCSWAVQCWYQVRKQADKAGGIPAVPENTHLCYNKNTSQPIFFFQIYTEIRVP